MTIETVLDLATSRPTGYYMITDPSGLPAGTYLVDNIDGKQPNGEHFAIQRAINVATGAQYVRNEDAGAYGSWLAVVADNGSGLVSLRRNVVEDGASVVLTAAQSGGLCVFDKTDGALFTLPAPEVGLYFDFDVDTVVATGSHKVLTNTGTVFLKGTLNAFVTGADADLAADAGDGSTHRSVTMNGTTTGGIAGTKFRVTCRSATVWQIEGLIVKSGVVATAFATS